MPSAPKLKVMVEQDFVTRCYRIYTSNPSIPDYKITEDDILYSKGSPSLENYVRRYIKHIIQFNFAHLNEIEIVDPRGLLELGKVGDAMEWAYVSIPPIPVSIPPIPTTWGLGFLSVNEPKSASPPESPFEVNMMECLVGWKGWKLNAKGFIQSPSYSMVWKPDEMAAATCGYPGCCSLGDATCNELVSERHTCGIYATDERSGAQSYGVIRGQVYGWGRYIRGDKGWRAQYAYPKSFYLASDQGEFIEPLKKYHVPIYIDEPLRVYDPEEEGYTHGYGSTEKEGNRGAVESTNPGETRDASSAEEN